ncbi:MAG: hypothetical protein EBY46_06165, partial [Rhodobacteraceae bacterium]|nr:hypothetical protein [Paracoccaceae bacterium]
SGRAWAGSYATSLRLRSDRACSGLINSFGRQVFLKITAFIVRNWGWIVSETIVDQPRTCRGDSGQGDGKLSDYILI